MNYTHVLTELHGWKLPLVRWLHTLCACVLPAAVHVFCALSGQEPADEKNKITIVVMYSNDIFKSSDLFRFSNFEQQNETTCSTCYTKINLTYYNDHQEISHKINVSFLKCSISVIKLSFMINRISYTVRLNSCI